MEGPRYLGHLLLLSQQGAGSEMEQPGHKPVPIWDASTTARGLIFYTTLLTPLSFIYLFYTYSSNHEVRLQEYISALIKKNYRVIWARRGGASG